MVAVGRKYPCRIMQEPSANLPHLGASPDLISWDKI